MPCCISELSPTVAKCLTQAIYKEIGLAGLVVLKEENEEREENRRKKTPRPRKPFKACPQSPHVLPRDPIS